MKNLPLLFLLLPGAASAEVMDKEFSLSVVFVGTVLIAVLLLVAARIRPWLVLALLPFAGLFFYAQLSEITDPYVGPAILQEAGRAYIISSWAGPFIALGGVAAGIWLRRRADAQQRAPADGLASLRSARRG